MAIDAPADNRPVIAVVDANAAVRSGVEALLRPLAARVIGFSSAREFLSALAGGLSPSCLVLDVGLPDMPPGSLLGEIRAQERWIPTILLAGDAELSSTVEAMRAGAITCIEKPYMARFLLAQVAPLVDDAQPMSRVTPD